MPREALADKKAAPASDDMRPEKKWKRINVWSIKGPLLACALILGFLSEPLHWARAPLAAGVAILLPIIGYRDFWHDAKFWITVALLAVVQAPLVMYVSPTMEQYKFPFMLAFGVADTLGVIGVLSLVCSEHK
jgi:hypothetical protein